MTTFADSASGTLLLSSTLLELGSGTLLGSRTRLGSQPPTEQRVYGSVAAGVVVLSGTETGARKGSDAPSGTATLSGASADLKQMGDQVSGDLALSGSITATHASVVTVGGAVVLSGAAGEQRVYEDEPAGAIVLNAPLMLGPETLPGVGTLPGYPRFIEALTRSASCSGSLVLGVQQALLLGPSTLPGANTLLSDGVVGRHVFGVDARSALLLTGADTLLGAGTLLGSKATLKLAGTIAEQRVYVEDLFVRTPVLLGANNAASPTQATMEAFNAIIAPRKVDQMMTFRGTNQPVRFIAKDEEAADAIGAQLLCTIQTVKGESELAGAVALPQATIPVKDASKFFEKGGQVKIGSQVVTYTGTTSATGAGNLTGCTGGTGAFSTGTAITTVADGTLGISTTGVHDSFLDELAKACLAYDGVVKIRLDHEFNWSGNSYGYPWETPTSFINGFRYWVSYLAAKGVTNVEWIWCVNVFPSGTSVDPTLYFPGDAWCDYVGVDAYMNFGAKVQFPAEIYPHLIEALRGISTRPIFINEFGAAADPTRYNKAAWYEAFFDTLEGLGVYAIGAFDRNKAPNDWTIDSSGTDLPAQAAFVAGVNSPPMVPSGSGGGNLQLSGSQHEANVRGDAPVGTATLGGSVGEVSLRGDAPVGAVTLAGACADARIGSNAPGGTAQLSGFQLDFFELEGRSSPSGVLSLGGMASSAYSRTTSLVGAVVLTGAQAEGLFCSDSREGPLGLSGGAIDALEAVNAVSGFVALDGTTAEAQIDLAVIGGSLELVGIARAVTVLGGRSKGGHFGHSSSGAPTAGEISGLVRA